MKNRGYVYSVFLDFSDNSVVAYESKTRKQFNMIRNRMKYVLTDMSSINRYWFIYTKHSKHYRLLHVKEAPRKIILPKILW
jgi:hypothetical protein